MSIEKLNPKDKKELIRLFRTVAAELNRNGIKQWDRFYPNGFLIRSDLSEGNVYGIREEGKIVAAVTVDRKWSKKYDGAEWTDIGGTPCCIHRLAVHPSLQGQGLGKRLLQFAEHLIRETGGTSIRLDVYSGNPHAAGMYERAGYRRTGDIRYPMRKLPYWCMEKCLK